METTTFTAIVRNFPALLLVLLAGSVIANPTITTHPLNQSVSEGRPVSFSATVTGTPAPTYQWQRNNTNLPGATASTYSLAAVYTSDHGAVYRVVVTNSNGSDTCDPATLTVTARVPSADSNLATWPHSRDIYINTKPSGAGISNDVYRFPLAVRLHAGNFSFSQARKDGQDLRFSKPNGVRLPHEIEYWDAATSSAVVWVGMDTVKGNDSTQHFRMYWGKEDAELDNNWSAIYDTASGFCGAWHLSEKPNEYPRILQDRTAFGRFGTGTNFSSSGWLTTVLGKGTRFDGSNDFISLGTNIPALSGVSAATFSSWVYLTHTNSKKVLYGLSKNSGSATNDSRFSVYMQYHKIYVEARAGDGETVQTSFTVDTVAANSWLHLAVVVDYANDSVQVYFNGVSKTLNVQPAFTATQTSATVSSNGAIGSEEQGNGSYLDGRLDEIQLSRVKRNPDWVKLAYENEKSASSILSFRNSYQAWSHERHLFLKTHASGADIGSNLFDFPILVRLNSTHLPFSQVRGDAQDLRFANANGRPLPVSVQSWDSAAGTGLVWVKVDTILGNNSQQYLRMHWGQGQTIAGARPTAVFDTSLGYGGVWHLDENPGGETDVFKDQTLFANHGTTGGGMSSGDGIAAKVAKGVRFDGSNDYLNIGDSLIVVSKVKGTTISTWLRMDSLPTSERILVAFSRSYSQPDKPPRIGLLIENKRLRVIGRSEDQADLATVTTLDSLEEDQWYHVTGRIDFKNDSIWIYVNGVPWATTGAVSFVDSATNSSFSRSNKIAAYGNLTQGYLPGALDEVHISRVARSRDWLKLTYENQKSGAPFLAWENEDTGVVIITSPMEGQLLSQSPVAVAWQVNGLPQTTQLIEHLVQGNNSIIRSYTDGTGTGADTVHVFMDSIPPEISASASPVDGQQGWYLGIASVSYTCSDETQLVYCTGPSSVTASGRSIPVTGSARDSAGNTAVSTVYINRDVVSPTLSLLSSAQIPRKDGAQITLTLAASDSLSGLQSLACNGVAVSIGASPLVYTAYLAAGTQSVACSAYDSAGNVRTQNFSLEVTPNTVPIAIADGYSVRAGDSIFIAAPGVLGNDTDADADTLRAFLVLAPVQGSATLSSDGSLRYRPALGFYGRDSLSYRVTDGVDTSANTWIQINVTHVSLAVVITSPISGFLTIQPSVTVSYTVNGTPFTVSRNLIEGPNTLVVDSLDDLGQVVSDTVVVHKDGIPPVVQFQSPVEGVTTHQNLVSVVWTVDGVVQTTDTTEVLSQEGANTITRTAIDAAGNEGTASINVILDTPAPIVSITLPLENQIFNHSPVPVVWTVNGLAQTAELSASLMQGSNRIIRYYTDGTGTGADTVNVFMDSIPPQITGTTSPVDGINNWYRGFATVSFACTDDTRLVFCSGPVSVTTNGKNISVSGQARDSAGNQNNASLFIKRDAISPILTLDSAKQLPLSGGARVTLLLTAKDSISGLKSLQCSGNTVSLGVQPISYQETLPLGSQSISCLAMDSAGNTFASAFSIEVTPNRVPYAVQDNYSVNASDSITATGLGVLTNDTDGDGDSLVALSVRNANHGQAILNSNGSLFYKPAIGFFGLDSISYRATDGKDTSTLAWVIFNVIHVPIAVNITSPVEGYLTRFGSITVQYSVNTQERSQVFSLVEGTNQLIVDTLDDLNQTIADTVNVIKDGIPPIVSISSPINNSTALVSPVSVVWSVDGISQSTQTSENLVPGLSTITRSAVDAAGNSGTASVSVDYSTGPILVKIHSPANGFRTNQTPMVVCWSVNGNFQNSDTLTSLNDGLNQIIRFVGDGTSADTVTVYFSQTNPMVAITAPVNGSATNHNPAPLAWMASGVAQDFRTVEYLQSGSNLVSRTFTDEYGNTGIDSIRILYDTIPPVVTVTAPVDGFTTKDSLITISWSVDGVPQTTQREVRLKGCCNSQTITRFALDSAGNRGSASIQVMFDGNAPIVHIVQPPDGFITKQSTLAVEWTVDGITQTTQLSKNLNEGANTLERTATDSVGNIGTHRITVNLDTRPPVVKINSPLPGTVTRESTIRVDWTADAIVQGIQNQATLVEGINRIIRSNTDAADNIGSDTVSVIRDTQGPIVQIQSPTNGYLTRNPSLPISWTIDGVIQTALTNQLLQEGNNAIVRTALDAVGNVGTRSVNVFLDTQGPEVQITSPLNGFATNNPILPVSWNVDGISQSNGVTQTLVEGPNSVSREFTDNAGNRSNTFITVTLDTQNPVVAILEPADGAIFGDSLVTVKWTVDGVQQSEQSSEILLTGLNTITRSYTDSAGNIGLASLQVSRDVIAPVVEIVSPSPALLVRKSTVNVSWKVDGVFQTVDTVQTLTPGENRIVRTFTDAVGNTGVDSVLVTYDAVTAPLEFTFPRNFALVTTPDIIVSLVVRENVQSVKVEGLTAVRTDSVFSVLVPLKDGRNTLMAVGVATDGSKFTASVSLTLDREAPRIEITSPRDLDRFTSNFVTVSGEVSDRVRSEMEANPKVTVNGISATVQSNTFSVTVPIVSGSNTLSAIATDSAGNNTSHNISVFKDDPTGGSIAITAGQNQSGPILGDVPAPLEVELRDSTNQLVIGRPVIFRVVKGDGLLTGGKRALAINTGSNGRAFVNLTLGSRGGVSTNQVRASSTGFAGDGLFTLTGLTGTPSKINTVSGERQQGLIRNHLPKPLIAVVTDTTGNPIVGVPVHFRVVEGDGSFGGNALVTSNSAENGWSTAIFTLGGQTGRDSQVVEADFDGNPGLPARFTFTAYNPGATARTTIEGVVLDNASIPLQGATVLIEESGQQAVSNAKGRFLIDNPPIGNLHLKVDGSTVLVPGDWATLEYEVTTLPGVSNSLGMPIFLVPRDNANGKTPLSDQDVTITIPQVPGFKLEIAAGSAQFPEDVEDRLVTATQVKFDKIPMPPGEGMQPLFIVTIGPPSVKFDPPARLTFPNVNGLAPGRQTHFFSFDHDLGTYVSIGTGTVSEDGTTVTSDPGFGIVKGGWHCGAPSNPTGTVINNNFKEDEPGLF